MRAAGIICEFNPFHNGHRYLIDTVKSQLSPDAIVCVMSGNFVQRGAPAMWDKYTRARAALLCGADLVLELPVCSVLSSADGFALAGTEILAGLGCVSHLAFGSETGNLELLTNAAHRALKGSVSPQVKQSIKKGLSYPMAIGGFISSAEDHNSYGFPDVLGSNDILATCYLKQRPVTEGLLKPFAVKRQGPVHHQPGKLEGFASGSHIRDLVNSGAKAAELSELLPEPAFNVLFESASWNASCEKRLFEAIRIKILTSDALYLSRVPEVSEGLENRFKPALLKAESLDELIHGIKSRRYTYARISRALMQMLLGIDRELAGLSLDRSNLYARVLGFNDAGAGVLRQAKNFGSIPVITNINKNHMENSSVSRLADLDVKACDIYNALADRNLYTFSDKVCQPVIIRG